MNHCLQVQASLNPLSVIATKRKYITIITKHTFGRVYITSKFNSFPSNFRCSIARQRCSICRNNCYLLKGCLEISQQSVQITRSHYKAVWKPSSIQRKLLYVRFNIAGDPVRFSHTCRVVLVAQIQNAINNSMIENTIAAAATATHVAKI